MESTHTELTLKKGIIMDNVVDMQNKFKENRLSNLETREISSKLEHDTTLNSHYTKHLSILDSPDFFVPEEQPIFIERLGKQIALDNKKAIINPDNGEVLSVVGSDYKVVTNSEVFRLYDEALSESDIDLTGAYKTVHQCGKGGRTILNYSFPAYETTITNRQVGDVVRLSCGASNSYDGLSSFSTSFDSIRLVCLNSMVTANPISYFSKKHTKGLVVEHAIQKIKRAIDVYLEHAEMYKKWADTPVTVDEGKLLFQKLSVKKGYTTEFNEKTYTEYMEQWVKEAKVLGRNRWSLYNAMTHIATHKEVQERTVKANNVKLAQVKRESDLRSFLSNQTNWFNKEAA